jgi:gas vesicle protein
MSHDRDSESSGFMAFILGGLTGAALALLYAPRSGRETRDLLSEKLREGADRTRDLREQARERGRAFVDEAAEYVERQKAAVEERKERFTAAVEAGRQAYREEKDRGNA